MNTKVSVGRYNIYDAAVHITAGAMCGDNHYHVAVQCSAAENATAMAEVIAEAMRRYLQGASWDRVLRQGAP